MSASAPRSGRVAVVLVHVLLAAVIVAGYVVLGDGRDPAARTVTLPDPDPRSPVLAADLAIVRPPGTVVHDYTKKQRGESPKKVLPQQDFAAVDDRGAVYVKAFLTRDDGLNQSVWQIAIADGYDPHAALRAMDELYATAGFQRAPDAPKGLLVRVQPAFPVPDLGTLTVYRAHYVHGPLLIRVEAYGPNQAATTRAFDALAARQLAEWPPT
jgi:hypothetical protein